MFRSRHNKIKKLYHAAWSWLGKESVEDKKIGVKQLGDLISKFKSSDPILARAAAAYKENMHLLIDHGSHTSILQQLGAVQSVALAVQEQKASIIDSVDFDDEGYVNVAVNEDAKEHQNVDPAVNEDAEEYVNVDSAVNKIVDSENDVENELSFDSDNEDDTLFISSRLSHA